MTMSGWSRRGRMGELDAATAELYARQAAAAAGAGRAAAAASDMASERGREQEQAQAAAIQTASDWASGTVRNQPHYARTALIFGAVGLGAYFLLRRPRPRRGR